MSGSPTRTETLRVFLAHSERRWRAEEVNATRLAQRANFVLTAITAVIGFKLFAVGRELDVIVHAGSDWRAIAFWTAAGLSAALFASSLLTVLEFRRRKDQAGREEGEEGRTASEAMTPDDDLINYIDKRTEEQVLEFAAYSVHNAAEELIKRNRQRSLAIHRAQHRFLWAIVLLVASSLTYLWLRYSSVPTDAPGGVPRVEPSH